MGKLRGFLEYERENEGTQPSKNRIKNYKEFTIPLPQKKIEEQGSRCMNCGIPFCHSACPLGNLIPDFNHAVHNGEWKLALDLLQQTNNFPEFTGRLCPAPCEQSCVLSIIKPAITIENLEKSIVEMGFQKNWIVPKIPKERTGKTIAIIGSGPAGLAAAQQLNSAGHLVTVFEKDDAIGGLLRYGIPNFKLEKEIIERRIAILEKEGIVFKTNTNIGQNYPVEKLSNFDAVLLSTGASEKRKLPIPNADCINVIQAMDLLTYQTKTLFNKKTDKKYDLKDKNVIVIGGGDTGSDCIGTANRHGAKSVTNFEILPKPTKTRNEQSPWPFWATLLKYSSSHEEGCDRHWLISTKEFITDLNNNLTGLKTVQVEFVLENGKNIVKEIPNSEKIWPCDAAILALGFLGPEQSLANKLNIEVDNRTNYIGANYQTNIPNIFVAGDARRGQSLIVWAISEGREAAHAIDTYLMGSSTLPQKGKGDLPSL